jgi:hypothetical protein
MDIALILDRADYMDPAPSSWVVSMAQQVVSYLPVASGAARVAVLTYGDNATINFNLGAYSSSASMVAAMTFGSMGSRSHLQMRRCHAKYPFRWLSAGTSC